MFEIEIDNDLQQFVSNVKTNWLDIYDFLTWRYAKSNLSENQKDAIHCYYYPLDVKDKVYNPHECSECYNNLDFFPSVVKKSFK